MARKSLNCLLLNEKDKHSVTETPQDAHPSAPPIPLLVEISAVAGGEQEEELGQRKRKVAIATESATTNTIHLLYCVVAGLNPVKKVPANHQYQ